jgi:hypothetical protein
MEEVEEEERVPGQGPNEETDKVLLGRADLEGTLFHVFMSLEERAW